MGIVGKWSVYKGFECVVSKHDTMGHYCGYVGIPKGHPDWGKGYDEVDIVVHGGLTFSEQGDGSKNFPNKEKWYFGFDCAHVGDFIPMTGYRIALGLFDINSHKWSLKEIVEETENMAKQFSERGKNREEK